MKSFPPTQTSFRQIFICPKPFLSQFKGTCFAVLLTTVSIDAHVLENHGGQVRLLSRCLIPVRTQRNSQRPKAISQAQRTQVVCPDVVDRLKWLLDGLLKADCYRQLMQNERDYEWGFHSTMFKRNRSPYLGHDSPVHDFVPWQCCLLVPEVVIVIDFFRRRSPWMWFGFCLSENVPRAHNKGDGKQERDKGPPQSWWFLCIPPWGQCARWIAAAGSGPRFSKQWPLATPKHSSDNSWTLIGFKNDSVSYQWRGF